MTTMTTQRSIHAVTNTSGSGTCGPGDPIAARELLAAAHRSLVEALAADTSCERYIAAHLAALRAAAALLAARGRPDARRRRVRSVWAVLPGVAPEFTEWCDFFASGARKRAFAEAGVRCVSSREADDLVRDVGDFLARVAAALGLPHQPLSHQSTLITGFRHTG